MRLVVPFSAGGSTDIVARTLALRLNELWGQAVVIDNRPGASTLIGTTALSVQEWQEVFAYAGYTGNVFYTTPGALGLITELLNTGIEAAIKRQRRTADLLVKLSSVSLRARGADLTAMVEEHVDNACSFSRRGTPIQITLDDTGQLTVTDHGRGMTPAQIEQIGAFHQFDRKKFEQQGLGLGLFIVRKLAARGGAELQIESRPGDGTTANLELPVATS